MRFQFEISLKNVIFLMFCGIVFLPLVSLPPWFDPPAWGKTVLFRIGVSLLVLLMAWHFARIIKLRAFSFLLPRSPVFFPIISLGVLAGVFLFATLFSLDFYTSFWNFPGRCWGFLNFVFCVLFALLSFLMLSRRQWNILWTLTFCVGIGVVLVAFAQQFGIKLIDAFIVREDRPTSTLGNPVVLGTYLALLVALVPAFLMAQKRKIQNIFFLLTCFILFAFGLLLTLSRGAWLGFFIAIVFFVLFYPRSRILIRASAWCVCIFGVATIAAVNIFPLPHFFQESLFAQRIWNRLDANSIVEDPRMEAWQGLYQAALDRPWTGYGLYNSSVAFDAYYSPQLVSATGSWDSAHNIFLDIMLWSGFPGLIAFLGFFGILMWQLQRVKQKIPADALRAHGMQTALVAYIAALLFSFDIFPLSLIFWTIVAYSFFLISQLPKDPQKASFKFAAPSWSVCLPVLLMMTGIGLGFIYWFNVKPFEMNKDVVIAVHEAQNGKCQKALDRMERLDRNNFFGEHVRAQYIEVIGFCSKNQSKENQKLLSQLAVDLLKESAAARPLYARTWILLGGYANNLLAQEEDDEEKEKLALESETYLQKARELSPRREEIFWELIRLYKLRGDYGKALEKANECIAIEPREGVCWWERAVANMKFGNFGELRNDIKEARDRRYFITEERLMDLILLYEQMIKTHGMTEYYKDAAIAYEFLIAMNPKNIQYYASLAFVYRELGKYEEARGAANQVIRINPLTRIQMEQFIRALPPR